MNNASLVIDISSDRAMCIPTYKLEVNHCFLPAWTINVVVVCFVVCVLLFCCCCCCFLVGEGFDDF